MKGESSNYRDAEVEAEEVESDPLDKALETEGITVEYLSKKLKAELQAERTEFAKFQGKILGRKNVIAWDIRQKARMDAQKLMRLYPADRLELDGELGVAGFKIVGIEPKKDGNDPG